MPFLFLGKPFEIMKSCQSSADGRAACLMCVALHGYHNSSCSYLWKMSSQTLSSLSDLPEEIHPCSTVAKKALTHALYKLAATTLREYSMSLVSIFYLSMGSYPSWS